MQKKVVLTGDRPTGPLHLGHYVGSLRSRLEYESISQQFVMIADAQALTDHAKDPEKVRKAVTTVMLDYLAVGLLPKKTTFFIQSRVRPLPELFMYYLNLVTWNRLKHNPTVKAEIQQKNFGQSVPAGFMTYPIAQAADITAFRATHVPVGEDQKPMLEQTNELVRTFNKTYDTDVLIEVKGVIPKVARLPGIDGQAKMGKSLNNAIFLSDSMDAVEKKVKKMYTDPNHLRVEDPGQVEGNPVFAYLDAFSTDTQKVEDLKAHYRKGGLGDSKVKQYLLEVLEAFLAPIQRRRKEWEADLSEPWRILREGSLAAEAVAEETLALVKKAMCLDYPI